MLRGVTVLHLRIARPTAQLDRIARMYREGLELEQLGGFEDHDGFDGDSGSDTLRSSGAKGLTVSV